MRKLLVLLFTFLILSAASIANAVTHRALVFGLGKQADTTWGKIHGDNDVHYVVQMLHQMGYTDIKTLKNEQATKQAMVDAFVSLVNRCQKGDVVYVHYSGHGQLMTDLDGDEALKWNNSHAQWDEAWIPYDAYMAYGPNDRGEKHFCDDEVARYLEKIRNKIGEQGEIVVVVDACHSGDATRDIFDDECVRGVDEKFMIPKPINEEPAKFAEEKWRTISACKPFQLCTEIKDMNVGKLSFALYVMGANVFKQDNPTLEKTLNVFMEKYQGRVKQTPMVSGKEHN